MPDRYSTIVTALKALQQTETHDNSTEVIWLPVSEDEWYTRPDTTSYGVVSLDFETEGLDADSMKADRAYEGSVDLFSLARSGAGWIPLIEETLTTYCGAAWFLNSRQYERENGIWHWEWVFRFEG